MAQVTTTLTRAEPVDYKPLFNLLLVSFGNVWNRLTLTGTIWAQFLRKKTY